jgi:hypothetical protein
LVFHRHTRYPFGRLLRESYLKPTLCSISALAILLALGPATDLSWFGLAAAGVVFGTLYFIGILISGFFDAYDRGKIKSLVPSLRYARKGSIA